jgi:hypothetical protein
LSPLPRGRDSWSPDPASLPGQVIRWVGIMTDVTEKINAYNRKPLVQALPALPPQCGLVPWG